RRQIRTPMEKDPLPQSAFRGESLRISQDGERRLQELFRTRAVPDSLQRLVEGYIARKTGKPWDDPVVLERIRSAIRAQKGEYWREGRARRISYRTGYRVMAYLAYQFPVFYFQTLHLFQDLVRAGLIPAHLRVLDVGTGPGIMPLALAEWYRRAGAGSAEVFAVEPSDEHREAFQALVPPFTAGMDRITIHPPVPRDIRDIPREDLPDGIDLLVFSGVLNEIPGLSDRKKADVVKAAADGLAPGGSILVVEPADLASSTLLRRLTREMVSLGFGVRGPCVFPWGGPCPARECWSFESRPPIQPTQLMERLAACSEPYRYLNTDLKYSWAVLQKGGDTGETASLTRPAGTRRLSSLPRQKGRRVTVLAAVMSGDLGDRDYHVYKVCDGTAATPAYAVIPAHRRKAAAVLARASYGKLLVFSRVLVRHNPQHDALNLLVDRESEIRPPSES
ncbi:MAG: class I SAM-dependent methyltransferase, partial [Methanomicrobiales archaeon]|nr:class I SAM-dependent methyltransferase [Methanomicrobiales archaeon]